MIRLDTHCIECGREGLVLDVTVHGGAIASVVVIAQPCGHDDACTMVAEDRERIADMLTDRARRKVA